MQEQNINQDEMEIDLKEIIYILWKKVWIIVLCAVIGAGGLGAYGKIFTVPTYSASSTIYVLTKQISGMNLTLSAQLTKDFAILATSRPVVENVISELDLDMSYETLVQYISVNNPEDSQLLTITATTTEATLSRDVANAMANSVANRIAEVMSTDKPNIAEEAVTPKRANGAGVKKNIMLGGVFGAALAVGAIVMLHLFDDTIKNEEDVKKYLGVETLASFQERNKGKKKRKGIA